MNRLSSAAGRLLGGRCMSRLGPMLVLAVVLLPALESDGFQGRGRDAGSESDQVCSLDGICALDEVPSGTPPAAAKKEAEGRVTLLFFWGIGCPHCEQAKPFVQELRRERPRLAVEAVEVRRDPAGRQRFGEVLRRLGVATPGIPTFVVGERYVVGFVEGSSEARIHSLVDEALATDDSAKTDELEGDRIATKWFGELSASELGLPLFTVALGLLDGFNPCAMWVLVFLLAMLAGQRDRKRMTITAGTFVVTSGLVYFAFMAAWLQAFLILGMSRALQMVLGAVALGIGTVNVKDFFVLGKGPSLSIPEQAKPGIYARVRSVLQSHTLAGSLVGVAGLAVLVNFVELLCTAGLPAIYTAVLARQELSPWGKMAYLGLYTLAYVADDSLMVGIAVATLSRRRLAESTGRWLKLLSGSVILALGLLLLLRPEWLP